MSLSCDDNHYTTVIKGFINTNKLIHPPVDTYDFIHPRFYSRSLKHKDSKGPSHPRVKVEWAKIKMIDLIWSGFKGISTIVGYSMPDPV